jgi:hypothetical protein
MTAEIRAVITACDIAKFLHAKLADPAHRRWLPSGAWQGPFRFLISTAVLLDAECTENLRAIRGISFREEEAAVGGSECRVVIADELESWPPDLPTGNIR